MCSQCPRGSGTPGFSSSSSEFGSVACLYTLASWWAVSYLSRRCLCLSPNWPPLSHVNFRKHSEAFLSPSSRPDKSLPCDNRNAGGIVQLCNLRARVKEPNEVLWNLLLEQQHKEHLQPSCYTWCLLYGCNQRLFWWLISWCQLLNLALRLLC